MRYKVSNSIKEERMLRSQRLRRINRQGDALRLGTRWSVEDLDKPQVLVESVYGDSHPGSVHLDRLVEAAVYGVYERGAKPAVFTTTDMCDGIAQAHDGMNYSLASRDIIAAMVEIHAMSHPHDALILISSCDKSIPAHLMAAARVDLPAIHIPGGAMMNGPEYLSSEMLYAEGVRFDRGKISAQKLLQEQRNACPSCGACQFMGTASTDQIISEALGMALPGSALIPTSLNQLRWAANNAGKQIVTLLEKGITPRMILTEEAFENAIVVHAAVAGSTNALLHLPAIAHEVGIDLEPELFDRIHRSIPVLADIKTSGKYPAEYLWYAGGVPAIMEKLKDQLHLEVLTVTGKTLGENLERIKEEGFYEETRAYLVNYNLREQDIIRPRDNPFKPNGGIAILKGNLAPEGAVVKHSAIEGEMHTHIGRARPFDSEESAIEALLKGEINPGEVVIIRYEGPKGSGMPEMLFTTEIIASDPQLATTTALVTDGRFSGATRGPAVGHISPEAADGGPLALVEENDLIKIDIPNRRLDIIGIEGEERRKEEIEEILRRRREGWVRPSSRFTKGVLKLYSQLAVSPMKGGYM